MAEWFSTAFGPEYLQLYAHRGEDESRAQLDGVIRAAELKAGQSILDLACGTGRYARPLAGLGYRVTGMDYSGTLLAEAKKRGPELNWVRGDMRRPPFAPARFDRVLSLFTSFGYFEDDAVNAAVLRGMAGLLKPGGRLYLDYLNPATVRESPWQTETLGELRLSTRKRLEAETRMVVKDVRVHCGGTLKTEYCERVKLYDSTWFSRQTAVAGLRLRRVAGGHDGIPFVEQSPRAVYLFEKV